MRAVTMRLALAFCGGLALGGENGLAIGVQAPPLLGEKCLINEDLLVYRRPAPACQNRT